MAAIYQPSGAAREYSPLALNYITGCDHGCKYCLDGETLLFKNDMSLIKIKDVQIGDIILGIKEVTGKKSSNTSFSETIVLNKISTKKEVYLIELENGKTVKCSGDHRWLTDRGWKYTISSLDGQRPFLTVNNKIRLTEASLNESPLETDNYRKGYLSGMIKGDGHMAIRTKQRTGKPRLDRKGAIYTWEETLYQFILRLKDTEGLKRSSDYLSHFGINISNFVFTDSVNGIRTSSKSSFETIKKLISFQKDSEFLRGFLAGIYDAEGGFTSRTIRISNSDPEIISFIEIGLTMFGFDFIHDKEHTPKNKTVKIIRIKGGEKEHVRFWQLTNPAISRKRSLVNLFVKANSKIKSITKLGYKDDLFDITTSTENFLANGLVSHNCYVPKLMKRFRAGYIHSDVYIKEEKVLMKELTTSFKKHRNSPQQVFLSFLTDPYSHFNNETKLTRKVLEMLLEYNIPVSILSKGGFNILNDLDVIKKFGANIQVGGSLTFVDKELSKKWETNSSDPDERFETLRILHENGIKTWASMEPVIYPDQSLEIMEITKYYVDSYKIGKLNHFPKHEEKFDWTKFLNDSISVMRKNNKLFYIKNDLAQWANEETILLPHERDMDYLALKNTRGVENNS